MDRFSKFNKNRGVHLNLNLLGHGRINVIMILAAIIIFIIMPAVVQAQGKGKIAVLPFIVQSPEPLDHLRFGLQKMLTSRMAEKGYSVINPESVNLSPLASQSVFENGDIIAFGKSIEADWTIYGNLTQVGNKVSLDLKVVDSSELREHFSIFMVEDNIDRLADAVERAAVGIDARISGANYIENVKVIGARRVEEDAIIAVIESKKGEEYDQERLDSDLRAVYRMGYFNDVNIEAEDGANGKIITFVVKEKPVIIDISFEGNDSFKETQLMEELGIKRYSILNPSEINQSINRLKEFYKQKGYYNVNIEDVISELPNNEVSLIYSIDEGEKVYIRKIEFTGNEIFSDDDLKDIMKTAEKGFFSWFTSAGILDRKVLEFDLLNIGSFYNNHGYIRARTGSPEIDYSNEDKGLKVIIPIIEGNQYKVNNITLTGDLLKPEDELLRYIQLQKDAPFNREVIHTDIQTLKSLYANDGYAYADVTPIPKEDDENYLVDITYKINKKKKVRFERINIIGNSITRDKVIRRELKVIEGDYFSGEKLNKSTENLYRLGFFEDIAVNTKNGSQDDLMVLDVEVKEQPTGSFSAGVGYSSFDKAMMLFQVSQNNLFGRGQKLGLQASLGSRTTEFDINFTEPWLFDIPLTSNFNIYNWKTEFDEYTKDSFGGSIGFSYPIERFDEYTRASIRYSYDDADVTDVWPTASLVIQDMVGSILTSSVTLGLERNSKDHPWNTRRGSVNYVTFEYSGGFLGGDSYFNKYEAVSAWFFPVWRKTVLMAKGTVGYIDPRSGGKLPIYEKYRLGGINSVRGYEWGTISPIDPATGDEIGGEKMWQYNLEYRFPLLDKEGIVGLVFFDAGNAFDDVGKWKTGARRSVGFGFRWFSPMGPLRLEYGIKLDKKPGESSGEFEFTMGGTF